MTHTLKSWTQIVDYICVYVDHLVRSLFEVDDCIRSLLQVDYIVTCQRSGVSNKPPVLQAATRHGL